MEKIIKCDKCDLPVARMVSGVLVVEARHHGEKHITFIEVGELVMIANRQRAEMRDRLSVLEVVTSDH